MLNLKTRMLSEEGFEGLAFVCGGVIQHDNERTPQVSQQLTKKQADLDLSNVVKKQKVIQGQLLTFWTHRYSGNDGDFIAAPLAMTMDGSLTLRCPGLDDIRNQ